MLERLLRRAVEQHGDVHTREVVVVAVGPFDDEYADGGHVDRVVPDFRGVASHALQHQRRLASLKLGEQPAHFAEISFTRRAEIALQASATRGLVCREPRMLSAQRCAGVLIRRLQLLQHHIALTREQTRGHQTLDGVLTEHKEALVIVVLRNSMRIVVAREHVGADA